MVTGKGVAMNLAIPRFSASRDEINAYNHTYTHTHTHARTHAHKYARTHTHTNACTHARTHARTHTHVWKPRTEELKDSYNI